MIVGLSSSGCSTSFPDYPIVSIAQSPYRIQKDFIVAAISPVTNRDESKKYFGVDMAARKILPVQVQVENRSDKTSLVLDRQKVSLEGSEQGEHQREVSNSRTGEILATAGAAALITGPLVAAPVALLIGSKMSSDAQMVQQNMMAKRLDRHTLSPGTAERGFVYFDTSRYKGKHPDDGTVHIELIELGTNKQHTIELPFEWQE
jgi:hypothetical protein